MMDTVLNLGLNPDSLNALIEKTGNERFAWDSYRRFIQMFGDVVMGVPHAKFEDALQSVKDENGKTFDTALKDAQNKGFAERNPAAEAHRRRLPGGSKISALQGHRRCIQQLEQ